MASLLTIRRALQGGLVFQGEYKLMKRIEVRLSLSVVAPLLDAIKAVADLLQNSLAASLEFCDIDDDIRQFWRDELVSGQNADIAKLLGLFGQDFFSSGVIVLDEENAEPIVRACAAVRLRLREEYLKGISDELLETGDVEVEQLPEAARKFFMCYLFLATMQELIIQHLEGEGEDGENI
ncbi:MAG: hypothetical protein QM790_04480 [Nibricoccus sp.]